jgi:hypothetical protein
MTEKRTDKRRSSAAEVIPLRRRGSGEGRGKGSAERCPICGKAASPDHRPFCSARCGEIDLGRWLKGVYRVPTDEAPSQEDLAEPGRGEEEPE